MNTRFVAMHSNCTDFRSTDRYLRLYRVHSATKLPNLIANYALNVEIISEINEKMNGKRLNLHWSRSSCKLQTPVIFVIWAKNPEQILWSLQKCTCNSMWLNVKYDVEQQIAPSMQKYLLALACEVDYVHHFVCHLCIILCDEYGVYISRRFAPLICFVCIAPLVHIVNMKCWSIERCNWQCFDCDRVHHMDFNALWTRTKRPKMNIRILSLVYFFVHFLSFSIVFFLIPVCLIFDKCF